MAVHVIIFLLVSFSLLFVFFIFLIIPSCLGDTFANIYSEQRSKNEALEEISSQKLSNQGLLVGLKRGSSLNVFVLPWFFPSFYRGTILVFILNFFSRLDLTDLDHLHVHPSSSFV